MSATTQPTSTLSTWRVAVVAAVAVLAAGIGLAVGGFLLGDRAAALGGGASYVPADAAVYFEVHLDPSEEQDAALRELLGRFPAMDGVDLDRPLYGQVGEWVDEMLEEEGASVRWAEDVEPWFDGRVAMSLVSFPSGAMDPTFDAAAPVEVPEMLVLLGVTDAEAARNAIPRLIEESAPGELELTQTEHRGVTIHVGAGPDGGAYAVTEDQVIIAPEEAQVRAALDLHAGEGETLDSGTEALDLTGRLPSAWIGFMVYDFTDAMVDALDAAGQESPEMGEAMAALLEHQPMRGAMAVTAEGDRLAFNAVSPAPTGPFAVQNAQRDLAAHVPADALYFSEGGNLGESLAAVITVMKDSFAEMPGAEEEIDTVESALGGDLEELVSWIGDGAMVAGWDGTQPYGGLVLVPEDRDAAERRLGQLASFASLAAMDPESGVKVSERTVAGTEIVSIAWSSGGEMVDPTMPMVPGVVVEYAITDDRVFVGIGDRFVARALELDESDSLLASDRFSGAIADLGGPENAGITWWDVRGTREALEATVLSFAEEMGTGDEYETSVRPWLLPFDRLVGVAVLDDDLLVQRMALLVE